MRKPPRLSLTLFLAGAAALSSASLGAFVPNDLLFDRQWQWDPLRNGINISGAWEAGYTGKGVVIGIVDEWLDNTHPDLKENYNSEWSKDFVGTAGANDPDKYPDEDHGTFVGGMAAATGGNGIGITGAAPHATLAGLHVDFNSERNLIDAFLHGSGVDESGKFTGDAAVRVKNCSFGLNSNLYHAGAKSAAVAAAEANAVRNNVIFVWAAGNSRDEKEGRPKNANADTNGGDAIESQILVAATDRKGKYAFFSSYGSNLFVSAPGMDVISTTRGSDTKQELEGEESGSDVNLGNFYGSNMGTSFSAPIVAGVIALAAAENEAMDARWAKHALAHSSQILETMKDAEDATEKRWSTNSAGLSFSNDYGFGMVNADAFVGEARNIAYETIRETVSADAKFGTTTLEKINGDKNGVLFGTVQVGAESLPQKIESVEVSVNLKGINVFSDLKISLVSPSGTESVVLDTSNMSPENARAMWNMMVGKKVEDGGFGTDGIFNWTFTTNAFWGVNESGDWQVKFENKGAVDATVDSASLKFNVGDIAYESANMRVGHDETLNVHALVLDKSSSSFTVLENGTLAVEDSVIMNSGSLTVGGNVTAYDTEWKGLKICVNGGKVSLEETGVIDAGRGVDVSAGSFDFNGGKLTGSLTISGGGVSVKKNSQLSSKIVMSAGSLTTTDGVDFRAGSLEMSGGNFYAAGKNNFGVNATGGRVQINGDETKITSLKISASETTASMLNVDSGKTLIVANGVSVEGFYRAEVKDEESGQITTTEAKNNSFANIGGTIQGAFSAEYAVVSTTGNAKFTEGVTIGKDAVFNINNDISLTKTEVKPGVPDVIFGSDLRINGGIVNATAGKSIEASSVVLTGGTLIVGGTGIGTTTIKTRLQGADEPITDAFVTKGGTIELAVGDSLIVDGNVKFGKNPNGESTKIKLSFLDALPKDRVDFIKMAEKTPAGAEVSGGEDVVVGFEGEVPRTGYFEKDSGNWKDQELSYIVNSNGVIEADLPSYVSLEPLRLTYSQMTPEQKAIAGAIRTCLSDGKNYNVSGASQKLVDVINSFESLAAIQSAYDKFLPVNLVTINDMHNKQASAIVGTIDRRTRELRNGFPTADLWAQPLFNTYGFSYSANPNAVAATGFRQFAGYDYDMPMMLWANGGYSFSNVDESEHTGKTENSLTNASIGFDYAVNELLSIGVFGTYSSGTTKLKDSGSRTEGSLRGIGLYLAGSRNDSTGSFYYTGSVSYGFAEYDFTRKTHVSGLGDVGDYSNTATASPEGSQLLAYIATGYEWTAGSQATGTQWTTGPQFSLRFARNSVDGYTERGVGIDQLEVDEFTYNSLLGSIGWRTSVRCNIRDMITFVPELRVAYRHEFIDGDEDIDTTFTLARESSFSTAMNKAGKDYASAGLGFTVLIAESLTVSLDYDVNLFRADSDAEHSVNMMVRCRF